MTVVASDDSRRKKRIAPIATISERTIAIAVIASARTAENGRASPTQRARRAPS